MKKRIIISVTSDLSSDPRVLKTAETLYQSGYELLLIGRKLPNSFPFNPPYAHKRLKLVFNSSFLFYAEFNLRLFFILLFIKSDLFLSNDTDTLPANIMASFLRRKNIIFDAHELFPEVPELVNRPFVKKFWTKVEDLIFPQLLYSYTVCDSIASYYNKRYGIPMEVVRNVPNRDNREIKIEKKENLLIYQGAVNVGRGLEAVIQTLQYLPDVRLRIVGDGDVKTELVQLTENLGLNDRVEFVGKVSAADISNFSSTAIIGLCLLENRGLSYYYSLPNRIFDYMKSGVQVLSSPFPEIINIVQKFKTGTICESLEPRELAETIRQMIENPVSAEYLIETSRQFNWETESKTILKLIEKALK